MRNWEIFLKVREWSSDYESVTRYLSHFKRKLRSTSTRELGCDVLMRFCKYADKDPDDLVKQSAAAASKSVQCFVDSLADKGQGITTVNVSLTFLRTFFRVNGFKANREIEVERFFQPSRYRKMPEYIPTSEEIYRMAYAAGSARNKAMIFCLYTSGLRNSTLRALRIKDVSAEVDKFEVVKVPVYPEMKQVDPRACKGNIPYYTFISKDAVGSLREYLNTRKSSFATINEDEPLFASTSSNVPSETRRCTPAKRNSLGMIVKRAAGKAGIKRWKEVHPHCLRKAFESALRNGGLDLKDQEFLMGHILPGVQDAYYDSSKEDELRRKYAQVNFFPERKYTDENFRKRQILDTAKMLGFPEDRIKKIEDALAKHGNVDEALDEIKKLGLESHSSTVEGDRNENGEKSEVRIIQGENKLVRFLHAGWVLVKELPENKFILKRSSD